MDQVNEALKIMEKLGINPLYLIAVVSLTMVLKALDNKNKFKNGYVLFPLFASLFVCLIDRPFFVFPIFTKEWGYAIAQWVFKSLVHTGLGSYAYQLYAKLIRDRKAAK